MKKFKLVELIFLMLIYPTILACGLFSLNIESNNVIPINGTQTPIKITTITANKSPGPEIFQSATQLTTTTSELKEFKPIDGEDFIFLFDPNEWELLEMDGVPWMIRHKTIENCFIADPLKAGHGMIPWPNPERRYINGRNWLVNYFDLYTYLGNYKLHLELGGNTVGGHDNPKCLEAQENVLGTLIIPGEGFKPEVRLPTFTPVPPFVCPLSPKTRLQVGDYTTTTTTVLLRSSPEKRDDNIIARLKPGVGVYITDWPVCGKYEGGAYAYYKIKIFQIGKEDIIGWVAEGDLNEYYLAPPSDYGS